MKPATDYKPSLAFGLLLHGPPKTGKSILACQFPKPYIADCDNNLAGPIRWLQANQPEQLKDIMYDVINVDDAGNSVPEPKRWERLITCVSAAISHIADPRQTIIIDGLGAVATYLQDHIVAAKSGTGKTDGMTISDWIPFRNMLSKLIVDIRSRGRLTVVTAHDEVNKDEVNGSILITPNIPSKLAGAVGGFFSDVWHTESEEVGDQFVYKVRTRPSPTIKSLGSSLNLPPKFQFTANGFMEYLNNNKFKTAK